MKQNQKQIFRGTVESLSHEAKGVVRLENKVVFVDGALPGEEIEFSVVKKRRKRDEATLENIITASPDRVEPKCEHFGVCGGCSLQHLSSDAQVNWKQTGLIENLKRIGKVQPENVLAPVRGDIWGYRRKGRLGARYVIKKERVLVGFREKSTRYLADLNQCEVLHESVGKHLTELGQLIASLSVYQQVPQVEIAIGDELKAMVIRHMEAVTNDDLEKLMNYGTKHGFQVMLQPKGPDTIHCIFPQDAPPLSYRLDDFDLEIQFSPSDFTQVNASVNRQMVSQAIQLLEPQADDVIMDLFCGLGNFSLALAGKCKQVIGVEGDAGMTQKAADNAKRNSVENVSFHVANLFESFTESSWAKTKIDRLLIDPPRSGAIEVARNLKKIGPKKLVYVSCDPATLARDAEEIVHNQGYRLTHAGVMDMFPHTAHVESIAVFER